MSVSLYGELVAVIVCSITSVKSGVKSYVGEMGKSMKAESGGASVCLLNNPDCV